MSKYCAKCGLELQDDDFLCPHCGAIWGDRIYRFPAATDTEVPVAEEELDLFSEPDDAPADLPNETEVKKQPRWVLPLAALFLVLTFGLFLIGSEWDLWAGESTSLPAATNEPATTTPTMLPPEYILTLPSQPDLPYTVYTVKFVDPYGTPIPGVRIESLFHVITDGYLSSSSVLIPNNKVISDHNGVATLILYKAYDIDPHVHILSVPQGYDQSMAGYTKYFAEGQTEMLIVLKFSDEPPLEIDPPDLG